MPEDYFGERVAARYDESAADMFDPAVVGPVVDFLAELAGGGAALELGIGTGRIALPLAERGVRVHGIDLSEAMVARLRAKPGAERIDVTIGDFATTTVDGTFSLAYVVFNTIGNLTTQAAQVACFRERRRAPRARRVLRGRDRRPRPSAAAAGRHDARLPRERDALGHRRVRRREPGARLAPLHAVDDGLFELVSIPFRYVWPAELDLMAELAGMKLRERWSGWQREPFTSESGKHVSVWQVDNEPPST